MPKLSKRTVETIRPDPAGRDVFVWDSGDGALKGFGVRMKPSGGASYLVQYRTREGRTRRLVLGKVGVLTPNRARAIAGDKLTEVAKGGDPSAERHRVRREALIVASLADLYLAEGPAAKPNKKASSWAADRSNIERHVKPLLGRKLAASLTHDDMVKFQRDVAVGKSKADVKTKRHGRAIVDGGPGTAARSLAVLGAMLEWAAHPDRKLLPANPAKGVKLLRAGNRERLLSETELAKLADALAQLEAEHRLSPTASAAIRLLLLSGCRKSEILSLRWEWVDIDRGVLRLPDSKTGAKVVPLAAAAEKLLAELPRRGDYVLPGGRGTGHYIGCRRIGNGCGRAPGWTGCECTICVTASHRSRSPTVTACIWSARCSGTSRHARPKSMRTWRTIRSARSPTAPRPGSRRQCRGLTRATRPR